MDFKAIKLKFVLENLNYTSQAARFDFSVINPTKLSFMSPVHCGHFPIDILLDPILTGLRS